MQVSSRVHRGTFSLGAAVGAIFLFCLTAMLVAAPTAFSAPPSDRYIVVLKDDVAHPANVAHRHEENRGAEVGYIYKTAIEGYSAELAPGELKAIKQDPNVDYVEPDGVLQLDSQEPSTGFRRVFAPSNPNLDIDEIDDVRIDADIAILDSGVAPHPDLNVVSRTDCSQNGQSGCINETTPALGLHGTHVAGIAAALDNNFGVVGTAPGARIWSVQVYAADGGHLLSNLIAGINWVTARSDQIEVVNMSLHCPECAPTALREAIAASVNKGVVYVVAAGNEGKNVEAAPQNIPAAFPDVITVSSLADSDGAPGGIGGAPSCRPTFLDDHLANNSNWGPAVDIAAPGVCIWSTVPGGGYASENGTSMATPFVTGAVAGLAATKNPNNRAEVEAIRDFVRGLGNYNWVDSDGVQEPLLDMSSSTTSCFLPAPPTPTETEPTPFMTSAGELNIFARTTSGEQISVTRSPANVWSVFNETSVLPCHPRVQSTQSVVQTSNGEVLVFARNSNNELVSFARTTAGAWSEWNLTNMVAGHPHITGNPTAVKTTSGELLVFARTTNNELVSFSRSPTGAWSIFNETAVVPGHPTILSTPTVYDWGGGKLSVFARSTNNELISFERTGAGAWSIFNETAVVPGHPSIADSPTPVMTYVGGVPQLLVFARTTNNELINFLREPSGAWSIFNETAAANGHPTITGTPRPILTTTGELLVFTRTTTNEMVMFSRSAGGAWTANNLTAITNGNPKILSSPSIPYDFGTGPLKNELTGVISVFCRATSGEMISFERTVGGAWWVLNETAMVSGHPHIE